MTTRHVTSSWISSLDYLPIPPTVTPPVEGTNGFLVVRSQTGSDYCYLIPSWFYGFLLALHARGYSAGRLYNRFVRGRFMSVKLEEGA